MLEVSNVFVEESDLNCGFYSMDKYDERITYCSDETLDSDALLNIINEYADNVNKGNAGDETENTEAEAEDQDPITLVYWKKGEDGHPVFQ